MRQANILSPIRYRGPTTRFDNIAIATTSEQARDLEELAQLTGIDAAAGRRRW